MGRTCSTNGDEDEYIEDIGGKAVRKKLLERLRCKSVDNIKMDFRYIGGMDWIDLAQDSNQWKALLNLRVP
jgi:hypothetical protein